MCEANKKERTLVKPYSPDWKDKTKNQKLQKQKKRVSVKNKISNANDYWFIIAK